MSARTTAAARALRTLLALPPRVQLALAGGRAVTGDDGRLDPGLQLVLRLQRRFDPEGLAARSVEQARRETAENRHLLGRTRTRVGAVRDVRVAGADGPLRARLYTPALRGDEPPPLLVFLHGGGFVLGDLDSHDEPCRVLCRYAEVAVLSVEYRLAPEHPFPAAVEDALAAFADARTRAAELGADPARVAVGGDSAGGNLAAVVAQQLRDDAGAPSAQVLIYPVVDSSRRHPSRQLFATGLGLTDADMDWFEGHYAGGVPPTDPRRSPLLAPDVAGLPPALVVTAAFDPLRDEAEAYAERLRSSGVAVVSWRAAGLVHGFLGFSSVHRASRDEVLHLAGAVRALLHTPLHAPPAAARRGTTA